MGWLHTSEIVMQQLSRGCLFPALRNNNCLTLRRWGGVLTTTEPTSSDSQASSRRSWTGTLCSKRCRMFRLERAVGWHAWHRDEAKA